MKALKHILVMGIVTPWIANTLVCYCAYWNTMITDSASAGWYLLVAVLGVFMFGLLVTIIPNVLLTGISFIVFRLVSKRAASDNVMGRIIVLVSLMSSLAYGFMVRSIAADIGTSAMQLLFSCFVAGSVGAWLNYRNWVPQNRSIGSIQPST